MLFFASFTSSILFNLLLYLCFVELSSTSFIPLEREIQLVRSYLYIEKVCFGERLQVHFDIGDKSLYRIPPLTVQPIVENAVHQGIIKQAEGRKIR
ncbi:sensor histidine kinase [Aneurinibacillus migulanus]|uniref:sensor histidine kinase n=1 Tax=Aneurinibacillus migulanus TaxID=47500 RepID=UPI003B97B163